MFFKRAKTEIQMSRETALQCVPLKNKAVNVTQRGSDYLRLSYPLLLKPWMDQLLRRLNPTGSYPPVRHLELDALGMQCWDMLDGNRSVAQIVDLFSRQRRVHPQEAEVAVTRFLRELGRRGIIGLKPER
jgi:hypothetical protein